MSFASSEVSLPDNSGRLDVLKVHARNKPLSPDVDLEQVARRTPGLSGASLMNLLNEAAIHAARDDKEIIEWDDVDWAIDRVTVGMEKPNKDAMIQDIELVAFHEAGHAIVGGLLPEYDTVTKISIVPRVSGAGGLTFFSPLEDRLDNVVTRHYLESQIAVAWGGCDEDDAGVASDSLLLLGFLLGGSLVESFSPSCSCFFSFSSIEPRL